METIELNTWEEFLELIKKRRSNFRFIRNVCEDNQLVPVGLYRGQANAEWTLQTTLERYLNRNIPINKYLNRIEKVSNLITTCRDKKWDVSDLNDNKDLNEKIRTLEFMAYLRQNGFPSPLLDWTRSPYIATFFAVKDCLLQKKNKNDKNKESRFAIYLYPHALNQMIYPYVRKLGHSIATDRKHYLQQCEYTFCLDKSDTEIVFANHESTLQNQLVGNNCTKYTIPDSDALKILEILDEMNINDYSLFESESALMSTLAQRHLADLRAD
ncbi:MAG: FRG domain-containing protein [Candidatus Auribacter fodinae]|jgi:hypothetical protein|uniref:FRG domain-containing protein n=1 Tax=Candidatus Auribacter fodinae TaxID=2093366 RepID=A0A3A4R9J3_9BACT|nr:MAG: FRG domain-containing protein [Candidatus Auribacter fodinae]